MERMREEPFKENIINTQNLVAFLEINLFKSFLVHQREGKILLTKESKLCQCYNRIF